MPLKGRTVTEAPKHATHIVRNRSSRNGAPVQAIAVHSTESADIPGSTRDLVAIRNWFDNPASQASAHIGIDGSGNCEVWVPSNEKAWTILQLNPVTVNIEFVGRAAQTAGAWEDSQIRQGAKWTAYWGHMFGIPMQRGNVKNNHGFPIISKKGVIRHKDLTDAGFGTHTDPGPSFPMVDFLNYCQWYRKNGWKPGT
jgi:N-acetyl-anhydromuramyl-L-alanine amidase AmpD